MSPHVPSGSFPDPNDRRDARKIVEKLGNNRKTKSDPATLDDIVTYTNSNLNRNRILRLVETMIDDDDVPVEGSVYSDVVYLTDDYYINPGVTVFGDR